MTKPSLITLGVKTTGLTTCFLFVFFPLILLAQEDSQKTEEHPSSAPESTHIGSSADSLSVETQITLGERAYSFKEYEKAFEYFQAAFTKDASSSVRAKNVRAKQEAAYYMGIMYLRGDGPEKDYDKALYWLNSAATLESDPSHKGKTIVYTDAQYTLSQIFFHQADKAHNTLTRRAASKKGLHWLKQAALYGHPRALFDLAQRAFSEKKYKEALRLFVRFINQHEPHNHSQSLFKLSEENKSLTIGHLADAHYKMGLLSRMFQNSRRRILKNPSGEKGPDSPENHFMKAVIMNHHPLACYELGKMEYLKGQYRMAFYWLHKVFFNKTSLNVPEETNHKRQAAYLLGDLYRNNFLQLPALTETIQDMIPDRNSPSSMASHSLIMNNNKITTSKMVDQMKEPDMMEFSEAEAKGLDPRQEPHRYMADYWLGYAAENGHEEAPALLYQHRYENATHLSETHKNNQQNDPLTPSSLWEDAGKLQPVWERRVVLSLPGQEENKKNLLTFFKDFDLPRLMYVKQAAEQGHPLAEYEWGQWLYNHQSFKEAYVWFQQSIKSWKGDQYFKMLFYSPDTEQQKKKQMGEAFFHLAILVHYQFVPLEYALKNTFWSRELAKALGIKQFFPLSPGRVEEIRFRQMIPYWLKGREEDVQHLLTSFLYKQAHDLEHPKASLHLSAFLKDQNLFETRPESKKTPGRLHLIQRWSHLQGGSKMGNLTGGGRLSSLRNRCHQVFSEVKSKTLKPFTK